LAHWVLEKQAQSARRFHKFIRVARTNADLAASPTITRYHVLEALSNRRFFLFGTDNDQCLMAGF
jgi:predicted ATPase with chaperone activity